MIIQLFRKLLKGNINDMEIKYTGLMRFEENGFFLNKQQESKNNRKETFLISSQTPTHHILSNKFQLQL